MERHLPDVLTTLYQQLESKVGDNAYHHDYARIVQDSVTDLDTLNPETRLWIRTEIQLFQFVIRNNGLKPSFISTDKDGNAIEEPSLANFSAQQLAYLKTRAETCVNPVLKARYAHLVWFSPAKEITYARHAINAYLQLCDRYAESDSTDQDHDHWLEFLETARNLVPLSASITYKVSEVRQLIVKHCLTYPLTSKASSVVRKGLAELMHSQKTIFKKEDCKNVVPALEEVYNRIPRRQLHHAIQLLEVIIAIEQKLEHDLVPWKRKVAQNWELLARERGPDAAIVTTRFCMKAVLAYEEIKDQAKVDELYTFYDELRSSVQLHELPLKFEAKELVQYAEELSDQVAALETDEIIKFLMSDPQVIPPKERILIGLDDAENAFLKDIQSALFDDEGNTPRHYATEDEKNIEQLIMPYTLWLEHTFQIVNLIVVKSIKNRKLTYHTVLKFLMDQSWLGQELTKGNRKDTKESFKWLSVIAPGIVDFFVTMEGLIYSNKVFNVATSFDSLTMKIEGLIRSLARYRGVHTFVIKRDNLGREVSEEKDIMRLLTEPGIIEFIGKDDIFFLRYLFTEKGGLNLRNKVAHSLLGFDQYSVGHLMLIFLAILRLSRFKLIVKPEDENKTEP